MASAGERQRAIIQHLLSAGAARDGLRPHGIDGTRLIAAIAGSTQQYDSTNVRNELQSMVGGSDPVERVGRDRYRLTSIAEGRQRRKTLAGQMDDDKWWGRGSNGNGDD